MKSLRFFYKEIILCIRRVCTLRYAEAKAFLSKNHLLTDIYIIQTKERSVSYDDTNYKRKGCQFLTDMIIIS